MLLLDSASSASLSHKVVSFYLTTINEDKSGAMNSRFLSPEGVLATSIIRLVVPGASKLQFKKRFIMIVINEEKIEIDLRATMRCGVAIGSEKWNH
jgi:hypothetical protein